jgi:hypothetical protein
VKHPDFGANKTFRNERVCPPCPNDFDCLISRGPTAYEFQCRNLGVAAPCASYRSQSCKSHIRLPAWPLLCRTEESFASQQTSLYFNECYVSQDEHWCSD